MYVNDLLDLIMKAGNDIKIKFFVEILRFYYGMGIPKDQNELLDAANEAIETLYNTFNNNITLEQYIRMSKFVFDNIFHKDNDFFYNVTINGKHIFTRDNDTTSNNNTSNK